ncbi:MAG: hypothetical protein IIV27_09325, partial [Clostridia bacterium]|nr:hypothetical protein [Clostridia bacterium]
GTCKVLHELGANNPTLYYTNQSNYVKSIMGCRTALPDNFTGIYDLDCLNTGNFAYTTLNLPLLALEADGDVDKFYDLLDKYCDIARDGLLNRRELVTTRSSRTMSTPFPPTVSSTAGSPAKSFTVWSVSASRTTRSSVWKTTTICRRSSICSIRTNSKAPSPTTF